MGFKNDKFKRDRGGYSRWLLLSCEKCKEPLFIYQKDGSGILKRLYRDRIAGGLKSKDLACPKCKTLLGVSIIYKKEDRPAVRLFVGAVEKKIMKEGEINKAVYNGLYRFDGDEKD